MRILKRENGVFCKAMERFFKNAVAVLKNAVIEITFYFYFESKI